MMGLISRHIGFNTAKGRKYVKDDFGNVTRLIQTSFRKSHITAEQEMAAIQHQMKIHSKGGADVIDTNFRAAVRIINRQMNRGEISTDRGMSAIAGLMGSESRAGARRSGRAMSNFADNVAGAMSSGKVSARKGLTYISQAFNKSAKAFGFGKGIALGLSSADQIIASFIPKARGGFLPGQGLQDTVPVMAAPDEAFLTRHQQKPVEVALRSTFGFGLKDLFAREQKPHYMARGGYPLGRRGAVIGTPHSGTHTLGNWQSDNAVDISVPVGTPVLAMADGRIIKVGGSPSFAGRFGGLSTTLQARATPGSTRTSRSATSRRGSHVLGGQKIALSGMANGVPHLHIGQQNGSPLAWAHGGGSTAVTPGGAAVSVPNYHPLGRVLVTGPDGLPKFAAQGALDKDRGLANRKLKQLHDKAMAQAAAAAVVSGGGGGGGGSKGPGGVGTFQGIPVANWIIPELKWARAHGWGGHITSGFRTKAQQLAAAAAYIAAGGSYGPGGPLASEHVGAAYPKGAVDVGGKNARGPGAALWNVIKNYRGSPKLKWGGPTIGDWGHFSGTGHARGGFVKRMARGGFLGPDQPRTADIRGGGGLKAQARGMMEAIWSRGARRFFPGRAGAHAEDAALRLPLRRVCIRAGHEAPADRRHHLAGRVHEGARREERQVARPGLGHRPQRGARDARARVGARLPGPERHRPHHEPRLLVRARLGCR
jgi:murein DD-endopeptidase MepM/ murein hydrolase activator NlpD